ncbi:MAG: hypothetical protein ACRETX_16400 [Steroidobacteraceae bacterium]
MAIGTDPPHAQANASVARRGDDDSFGPNPLGRGAAPDTTVALFGESGDLSGGEPLTLANEDSAGDLDDLFADLVKD